MKIAPEMERLGMIREEGMGVFAIDFSAYHFIQPIELGLSLSTGPAETGNVIDIRAHGILNHRYPNDAYTTLSDRYGRKRCRTGSILMLPMGWMSEYGYLNFLYSIGDEPPVRASIPLFIKVTPEKPSVGIDLKLELEIPERPEFILQMYEKTERGWKAHRFLTGDEHLALLNHTKLTPMEDTGFGGVTIYREIVQTIPQRLEDLFI